VVRALALVAVLAGTARADVDRRVGWDFGVGALPAKTVDIALGIALDQRIAGAWFATAAFRWHWIDQTIAMTTVSTAGPALELGVRHRLTTSHRFEHLDLNLDGEAGIAPQMEAYAGLRFGYRITEHMGPTAQHGFDFDVGLRAIASDRDAVIGIGGMFMVAMAWDD